MAGQIQNWHWHWHWRFHYFLRVGSPPSWMTAKLCLTTVAVGASIFAVAVNPAKAILNYNIYEESGNLIIETSGSLNLPAPSSTIVTADCNGNNGAIAASIAAICTGLSSPNPVYQFSSGPSSIGSSGPFFASSTSGITTLLFGTGIMPMQPGFISLDSSYVSGTSVVSQAVFSGLTLADLALTSSFGTVGTWTLVDTGDTVNVNVVPGPLPLFGAAAAFGFSRRLRRRIQRSEAAINA
ncbi:MAG: hypothetical protein ACK587_03940 [Cyanobacteriota bacterium]